ncbi:predicted protein [Uncinocarpus reesii 1704]|uniref:Uncharacterized protein n=1 Tax=Uncinocarpus reesii (strain UAMH 1704) TaxID=336963 RepID=C4JQK3_UNCRE|nr:uncharacterized protein UREG_03348 [Uncinocarpus reesii 1704]EEP78502.1 predicted protein [Uncinocarpus reesii 1704]
MPGQSWTLLVLFWGWEWLVQWYQDGFQIEKNQARRSSGNIPGVALWDVYGKRLGEAFGSNDRIENGSPRDVFVPHFRGIGEPLAEYVAISNGGIDAICIAWIAMAWNDAKYGWIGDVGQACGSDWYYTQTLLKESGKDGKREHRPRCVWIDRDGSNGFNAQGFSMHIIDFDVSGNDRKTQYQIYPETMCSRPRYHTYKHMVTQDGTYIFSPPLEYGPGLVDKDIKKVLVPGKPTSEKSLPLMVRDNFHGAPGRPRLTRRALERRSKFMRDVLVVSGWPQHKAEELCKSETSVGPDFASLSDKLFCDMEHKELWPLCTNGTITNACFDVSTKTMRGGGIGARDLISGRAIPEKSYSKIRVETMRLLRTLILYSSSIVPKYTFLASGLTVLIANISQLRAEYCRA